MSEIQSFYDNLTVLVTGCTGFIGKLLVEKLLRTCGNVKKMYLLVRENDGILKNRRYSYFNDKVFDRVRLTIPNAFNKVQFIKGDVEHHNLKIDPAELTRITYNVNIVFHAAATTHFKQDLRSAFATNSVGTLNVLNLCKSCKFLKAFVHVSTAYAYCHKEKVDETIDHIRPDFKDVVQVLLNSNNEQLEEYLPGMLGKCPNVYTFTKRLAEDVIVKERGDLPVAIFRPGIVISTVADPVPGWIENFSGPTLLTVCAVTGSLHCVYGNENVIANIVPADYVVNAIIAAAWDVATGRRNLIIYNYAQTNETITWGKFGQMLGENLKYPLSTMNNYVKLHFTTNMVLYGTYTFLNHFVPAFIRDIMCKIVGKPSCCLFRQRRMHGNMMLMSYFTTTDLIFSKSNVTKMWERMNLCDKHLFRFNMTAVRWPKFIENYLKGIRVYLLHDELENLPAARENYEKLNEKRRFSGKVHMIFVLLFVMYLLSKNKVYIRMWQMLRRIIPFI